MKTEMKKCESSEPIRREQVEAQPVQSDGQAGASVITNEMTAASAIVCSHPKWVASNLPMDNRHCLWPGVPTIHGQPAIPTMLLQ